MQEKSVNRKTGIRGRVISLLMLFLVTPVTLILGKNMTGQTCYLISLLVMVYGMVPFFLHFERRRPQAREVVTIAVMSAIAAASRAAFMMVPHFKPIIGIIMIAGMALGAEAGFLVGAIGALVSNFLFGQGPWTPWQMFAYGMSGFLAGILVKAGILKPANKIQTSVIGAVMSLCVVGPLLDTATLFLTNASMRAETTAAVYLAGLPVNAVLAVATALTLFFLTKPMMEKLERIRIKYGMMEDELTGGESAEV